MEIREYVPSDCERLAKLFYDTVHSVNAADYTKEQTDAWADGNVDIAAWNESFMKHYTVVAMHDGDIAGFGDIDKTGYLDRLYVRGDLQRRGAASAICDALESSVGTGKVTAHVSITARAFFEKRGYAVLREQQVERHGVLLTNYVMEKETEPAHPNL